MKLELKNLAPYLPYGLKVMYTHGGKIGEIKSLLDISEYDDIKIRMDYQDGEHIWMFKPILRPLSDLHTEIQHTGGKIIPANWLYIEYDITGLMFNGYCDDPKYGYEVYLKLFEWHFDVFGLIPAGLAIDINQTNPDQDH